MKLRGRKRGPRSLEVRKKISNKLKGDKAPNWRGGLRTLDKDIRRSFEYNEWRMKVFKRDRFVCIECGVPRKIVNAHHIKEMSGIIKENNITTIKEAIKCKMLWNLDNGMTLCRNCHYTKYHNNLNFKI